MWFEGAMASDADTYAREGVRAILWEVWAHPRTQTVEYHSLLLKLAVRAFTFARTASRCNLKCLYFYNVFWLLVVFCSVYLPVFSSFFYHSLRICTSLLPSLLPLFYNLFPLLSYPLLSYSPLLTFFSYSLLSYTRRLISRCKGTPEQGWSGPSR